MANVRVEGGEQLAANLNRIAHETRGRIGSEAVDAGGELIQQKAHDRCAIKGEGSIDGYYQPAEVWSVDPARAGAVKRSIKRITEGLTCRVGSNHMIAPKLEKGLPSGHEPRPFMRPALDENINEAQERIGTALWQGITGVVR